MVEHHAAMNANYLDVVTLVEEGGADIFKKDHLFKHVVLSFYLNSK